MSAKIQFIGGPKDGECLVLSGCGPPPEYLVPIRRSDLTSQFGSPPRNPAPDDPVPYYLAVYRFVPLASPDRIYRFEFDCFRDP